jgi:hypothetical protein
LNYLNLELDFNNSKRRKITCLIKNPLFTVKKLKEKPLNRVFNLILSERALINPNV